MSGHQTIYGELIVAAGVVNQPLTVWCPAGKTAIGFGYAGAPQAGGAAFYDLTDSFPVIRRPDDQGGYYPAVFPTDVPEGWHFAFHSVTGQPVGGFVGGWVTCIDAD